MSKRVFATQFLLWTILLILMVLIVTPVLWAVAGSFKTNTEILNYPFKLPTSLHLENYKSAWTLGKFDIYLFNTVFITFFGLIIGLVVASTAGYALAHIPFRGSQALFFLFLVGLTLPTQTIIIPLFYLLKSLGLVNTLWGVILASVGMSLPFGIFLMRNTFRGLPKELRESAYVDGAGEWMIFFKIMLPLAKPGLVALAIFKFMNLWNEYLLPLVVLIKPDKFTIAIGLASFQTEQTTNYQVIFAGAVISLIPVVVMYLFFQRHFIEGVVTGAQKG